MVRLFLRAKSGCVLARAACAGAAAAVVAVSLIGCEVSNPLANAVLGAASEAKILSLLKEYQAAQSVYQMDSEGCFGSLEDLRSREMVDPLMYAAWDGVKKPVPVAGGYVVSDLHAAGGIPDSCSRTGICFYPASGNGGYVYCALADMDALNAPELRDAAVTHGEEWTMYRGSAADFRFPLDHWLASEISSGKLKAYKKYSPQEGAQRARALAGGAPGMEEKLRLIDGQ